MHFTDANFETEVLKAKNLVLVDFFAEWCGPCKMMSPAVDELAKQYKAKAKIGKIDVDESSQVAGRYGVMSIPTIIFFKNGEEVDRVVGFQPKEALEEKIKQHQ